MSDRMITSVITTYKRPADTVKRAVMSVVSQDYRPLELIIVDDNRDDDEGRKRSGELSALADAAGREHSDIPVRLIRTKDGLHGAQAARNTGIVHGKGAYIAFLDDDDEWLPGKLTAQMDCLEKNPEAGMCFCRGYRVDLAFDPPYINDFQGAAFRNRVTYIDLLRGDCIGTTSQALIPVSTFERVGMFDEALPARQDYEMWIRIASAFPIVGVDEHYFNYYKNAGGVQITRSWDKCIKGHTLLYRKYKKDIDSDRAARFNVIFYMAHYYMCKGDRRRMIKYYSRAFFTSPVEFFKKGLLKLEAMSRDRRLGKKHV